VTLVRRRSANAPRSVSDAHPPASDERADDHRLHTLRRISLIPPGNRLDTNVSAAWRTCGISPSSSPRRSARCEHGTRLHKARAAPDAPRRAAARSSTTPRSAASLGYPAAPHTTPPSRRHRPHQERRASSTPRRASASTRSARGAINTPMVTDMIANGELDRDEVIANQPIVRLGRADEMAATVLWLCSFGASFVLGVAPSPSMSATPRATRSRRREGRQRAATRLPRNFAPGRVPVPLTRRARRDDVCFAWASGTQHELGQMIQLDDGLESATSSPSGCFACGKRQRALAKFDRACKRRHARSGSAAECRVRCR
jgi:hypothetical protein